MMVNDLATVLRDRRSDEACSLSEAMEILAVELSWMKRNDGSVFWRLQEEEIDDTLDWILSREINFGFQSVLTEILSRTWRKPYIVQFLVPKKVGQHVYLTTTADQPFAVGHFSRGLFMYRQRCMRNSIRVDEGAAKEELGAAGRAYRERRPESTPDLRLYTVDEFPLRDFAARCGLRSYYALPVFDSHKEECYGVMEVLCFQDADVDMAHLQKGLQAGNLRTSHLNFSSSVPRYRGVDSEITKMLELVIKEMPQLHMALVWACCLECSITSNESSCMEIAETFVNVEAEKQGSLETVDYDIHNYVAHCRLHNLQIGKPTNMTAAVISSNNKACICRNICDFGISENPLAHYAQKARLSSCFAVRVERLRDTREFYVVEFFLQLNNREDAFAGSFLPLLLRIMEMKLESFNFPYKGQRGGEFVVEVLKGNELSSGESSQSNAHRHESIKYKHQSPEELSMLMVMEGCEKRDSLSDFIAHFQKGDLQYIQPSEEQRHGLAFLFQARQGFLELNPIQESLKIFMLETSKGIRGSHSLVQLWVPIIDKDRHCLETLGQAFALGCQNVGLVFFRKQSMKHRYFLDMAAKKEELGPPGRVFLNRHPEISPDLRLYPCTEFSLRNDAAHCGLRRYLALPVFDNQCECIGVLEVFGFSNSTLQVIENALKVAKLSSTHINYKPSFLGRHLPSNATEHRQLALTEIREACKLFNEIPQLNRVEVWVPCDECPSINYTMSCMERVWPIDDIQDLDLSMCKFQHVEDMKGIAGMALASKNKSCFCQNLCEFSIVEQPLAHYAQRHRLHACFAICLHSCHTGDDPFILEFYLNQGPGKYENLRSFLCLLLPRMREELKSFKLASGQQLGENLVVTVIEFSEGNELTSPELDQPDTSEIAFEFVKYHKQKLSNDTQVQFVPEESVTSVAQAEHCSSSAVNLNEKTKGKKRCRADITLEDPKSHSQKTIKDAARALDVAPATLKRRLQDLKTKWSEMNSYNNTSYLMREIANESARDSQHNLPPSDMPLHQNAPHADPQSSQSLIVQPKVDAVLVKVKYEDKTIKFRLHNTARIKKLEDEVALRLKLRTESFKLKYIDDDKDEILLACDDDLQLCLESPAAVGETCIQMIVQSI